MGDNNFIISRGNVPRNFSLDEEMNFMNESKSRKLQNVNGVPLNTEGDFASPSKPLKVTTSLPVLEEKTVLQEKTVCYVSNFDLQSK